ncbi:histidine phosphatase family protein [Azotobacter beijerinckii]|uniref:histidine phosphatase family protein n=1 Tax=Azotobacter beijerinckii TaxID=170623 RepID=UPI00295481A1|nr:histidine phosphatase family protein [Azotobacter beijerinckii]MDV7212805.1 histidine phosphatase family protein [Azotobacter beijerinckii]
MGSIYLIRHGQASFGALDYDVLSPLGKRQAEILGTHLVRSGIGFDRCISGSLRRQQHTASATLEQLHLAGMKTPPIETDPAFNEIDIDAVLQAHLPDLFPARQDMQQALQQAAAQPSSFQRLFSQVIEQWISSRHEKATLESWNGFRERVQGGLDRLLADADPQARIAVFTSGGPIITLLHLIVGVSANRAFELAWQIANTSFSQLRFQDNAVTLASFNSHAHLEMMQTPELITYL